MTSLAKMLSVGRRIEVEPPLDLWKDASRLHTELYRLLSSCNGLYCFESALHLFASGGPAISIEEWNAPALWRATYDDLADGCFFFAEDAFGNQFAIREDRIVSFEAETGQIEDVAETVEEWGARVMQDYEYLSGFPLAHAWQESNGPLRPGTRLVPKIPFVMGGDFSAENLHALDAVRGMRWRGDLAVQIRNLPDGASIELKVV